MRTTINRSSVPLYGRMGRGTLIKDGNTFADWTLMQLTGTGSTLTEDTDGSAILTVPAGESAAMRADINIAVPNTSIISFGVWCSDDSDDNISVGIDLDTSTDNLFTSVKERYHTPDDRLTRKWTVESLKATDMQGSGSWGTLRKVRLIVDNSGSAVPVVTKLGDIYMDQMCDNRVVITFDDGTDDHKAAADDLLAAGMKATFFVYSDNIAAADADYLSLADCQAMYADGHDIANHTTDGTNLTLKTPAQQIASISDNADWIRENVGTGAETLLAYPGGLENAEVESSAVTAGVTYARKVKGYRIFPALRGIASQYQIYGSQILTTSDLQAALDDLYARNGGTMLLVFHQTDHPTGSGVQITAAQWAANVAILTDAVNAGEITVLTMSEWVDSMRDNPRALV